MSMLVFFNVIFQFNSISLGFIHTTIFIRNLSKLYQTYDKVHTETTILSKILECDNFHKISLPFEYSHIKSTIGSNSVACSSEAYTGEEFIRYFRIINFQGGNYSVMNIMAVPYLNNSLPILGIDVVSLPGTYVYFWLPSLV